MKTKKNIGLMILIGGMCVALFLEPFTGEAVHAVLGIMLFITVVGHTCRQIATLKHRNAAIRIVDEIMMVSLCIAFVSGMLLHPLGATIVFLILHKLSAIVFTISLIAHVVQHCPRKIKRTDKEK